MMDEKQNFSYLFGSNAPYIEELYEEFSEQSRFGGRILEAIFFPNWLLSPALPNVM